MAASRFLHPAARVVAVLLLVALVAAAALAVPRLRPKRQRATTTFPSTSDEQRVRHRCCQISCFDASCGKTLKLFLKGDGAVLLRGYGGAIVRVFGVLAQYGIKIDIRP